MVDLFGCCNRLQHRVFKRTVWSVHKNTGKSSKGAIGSFQRFVAKLRNVLPSKSKKKCIYIETNEQNKTTNEWLIAWEFQLKIVCLFAILKFFRTITHDINGQHYVNTSLPSSQILIIQKDSLHSKHTHLQINSTGWKNTHTHNRIRKANITVTNWFCHTQFRKLTNTFISFS